MVIVLSDSILWLKKNKTVCGPFVIVLINVSEIQSLAGQGEETEEEGAQQEGKIKKIIIIKKLGGVDTEEKVTARWKRSDSRKAVRR